MRQLGTLVIAAVVAIALAGAAAWGIVSASTAAPDQNPASNNVVQYGD